MHIRLLYGQTHLMLIYYEEAHSGYRCFWKETCALMIDPVHHSDTVDFNGDPSFGEDLDTKNPQQLLQLHHWQQLYCAGPNTSADNGVDRLTGTSQESSGLSSANSLLNN